MRKLTIILMSLVLCCTTLACGSPQAQQSPGNPQNSSSIAKPNSKISNGKYPVQQATYNDGDGSYSLMLLNTPPGSPPVFNTTTLQMARLTDEDITSGEKTYLDVNGDQLVMYLTEDFKIEYVHNVTETRPDPQTGQQQTVIVRRESSFWTPFAGALAGQVVGNLLFRPQYYVPPVYQPGTVLTGYGGYGRTYTQAVDSYRERYQTAPAAVKNRQTFRTTGNLRNTSSPTANTKSTTSPNSNRSTGSGFGSSNLQRSNNSSTTKKKSTSGFGSSRKSSGFGSRRSFGGRRR